MSPARAEEGARSLNSCMVPSCRRASVKARRTKLQGQVCRQKNCSRLKRNCLLPVEQSLKREQAVVLRQQLDLPVHQVVMLVVTCLLVVKFRLIDKALRVRETA